MALFLQVFMLVLLVGVIGLGYRQWVQSRAATLDGWQRSLLLLVLMTLVGGFLGAPFWWMDQAPSFPWDLPPFASRLLAAAGWSFAVACLLTMRHPAPMRLRLILLMLFVYLVPLVGAILVLHLDRFDPRAPITYAFFGIVGTMVIPTIVYLLRPVASLSPFAEVEAPPPPPVRAYLLGVALLTGLWGIALFVTDRGPLPAIWAWPGDLLSSQLIAVMLATIAVSSLYGVRSASVAQVSLATLLTYGLGVALASLWSLLGGKAIQSSYLLVFGFLFLSSGALLLTMRPLPQGVPASQG